jgi:hypothetical protein
MYREKGPHYQVEVWDDAMQEVEETLARTADPQAAKRAYEQAVRSRGEQRIVLRKRGRVLNKNWDD